MKKILGISGSPVKNSNTDRLVKKILKESELEGEFIKLSENTVAPCKGCKACVNDNKCKVNDDFNEIAKKLEECDILVLGAYTPYGMIDGFTKAFLERLWSMRHLKSLNEGKKVITVVSSLMPQLADNIHDGISLELNMEKMDHIGKLTIQGSAPCLTCGAGDICKNSAARKLYGENVTFDASSCNRVEAQRVWQEASECIQKLKKELEVLA